ncbi:MAG: VPLPA-CTERM sorting domain-containing protein [Gammaproteobacteria bacterium]
MKNLKLFVASVVLAMGLAMVPAVNASTYNLESIGANNVHGFGSQGLYLGDFDARYLNHEYTNWVWTGVLMDVDMESGTATISGDMIRGTSNIWGVEIQLSGMSINSHGNLEWSDLNMSLTAPSDYHGIVPTTGWIGYEGEHDHVASLEYLDDGTVRFDAWYQNPDAAGDHNFYRFGDTKAIGNPVPVPAAIYMMLSAIGALGALRRR